MLTSLPRQSPFRQQLIPPITQGLSSTEAATALQLTRQTVWKARTNNKYTTENMFPPATPSILTTPYPLGTKRSRKLYETHSASRWLKDNLPVKSGSKYETYVQHDQNYKLYEDYKKDMKTANMGECSHHKNENASSSIKLDFFFFICFVALCMRYILGLTCWGLGQRLD